MRASEADYPSRRLKAATAELHQRVEDGVDIVRRVETQAGTVDLLLRMEAFYRAFEPLVAHEPFFVSRLAALRNDLERLAPGWSPLAAPDLPPLENPLGGLYVIEGAALGGQIIARILRERLGFESAFFGGSNVGPRWREFRAHLDERGDDPAVERSAVATFLAFERTVVQEATLG